MRRSTLCNTRCVQLGGRTISAPPLRSETSSRVAAGCLAARGLPRSLSIQLQAAYKPKAGLLHVETQLEGKEGQNLKVDVSEEEPPTTLKLQSTVATLPGVFAAGIIRQASALLLFSLTSPCCSRLSFAADPALTQQHTQGQSRGPASGDIGVAAAPRPHAPGRCCHCCQLCCKGEAGGWHCGSRPSPCETRCSLCACIELSPCPKLTARSSLTVGSMLKADMVLHWVLSTLTAAG